MLTERDSIETWPEQGITFEPVKLNIGLSPKILDSQRLKMVGLASTLTLLAAGCTEKQNQNFLFGLGGFAVNSLLTLANVAVWSDDKSKFWTKAGICIGAVGAVGCLSRELAITESIFLGLFLATGAVYRLGSDRRE